jgi:hypothetical protein
LSLILRIIIIIASTAYLKAKLINYALRSFWKFIFINKLQISWEDHKNLKKTSFLASAWQLSQSQYSAVVNLSRMSPKLLQTYLCTVENRRIKWHHYFWDWYHENVLPNQFKIHIHFQNQHGASFLVQSADALRVWAGSHSYFRIF